MKGRTMISWDKDDIDTLNILKIDILSLGMHMHPKIIRINKENHKARLYTSYNSQGR